MAKGYHVIGSDAAIHPVGNEQPDTEVLALTTALHDEVEEWLDQPVGNVEGDMTIQKSECRTPQRTSIYRIY